MFLTGCRIATTTVCTSTSIAEAERKGRTWKNPSHHIKQEDQTHTKTRTPTTRPCSLQLPPCPTAVRVPRHRRLKFLMLSTAAVVHINKQYTYLSDWVWDPRPLTLPVRPPLPLMVLLFPLSLRWEGLRPNRHHSDGITGAQKQS